MSHWSLIYEGYDPAAEGVREALCTLANGYVGIRGAAPESRAGAIHYPGTYLAGCYNRLTAHIDGRDVESEDMVNAPNWLSLTFRIEGGPWFDVDAAELLDYRQELDLKRGLLMRRLRFRDEEGRTTALAQRRIASMHDPHLVALETTIEPEDWSGVMEVRSALDGRVTNAGVRRYRRLPGAHLRAVAEGWDGGESSWLQVRTSSSHVRIALAARLRVDGATEIRPRRFDRQPRLATTTATVDAHAGMPVTIEKVVAIHTSDDPAVFESLPAARDRAQTARSFDELVVDHVVAWGRLWRRGRLRVPDDVQLAVNVHLFHVLQTLTDHVVDVDAGVPARGLHGEAYRGHVFWDEVFVFPFLTMTFPEVARTLLMYRWRRLGAARRYARDKGHRGAMYPWQSGSDGRDETPTIHLNPRSGRWVADNSQLQRHVGLAIAHNVWQYVQATGDRAFLAEHGAEMLVEITRFWSSVASFNRAHGRYEITGIMGPDEYHDAYPKADRPGVDNNAYTNVMVARIARITLDALAELAPRRRAELREKVALNRTELDRFEDLARRMRVVVRPDGVIDQFEGYTRLDELDWPGYRRRYGDIRRLDRILEAEQDTVNRYQASKQADVLMLLFVLGVDGLRSTLVELGYDHAAAELERTIDYYRSRTSHGSTLSAVVHAWALARLRPSESWTFFRDALAADIRDGHGGTTREGIHLGAMAGTIDLLRRGYTGLDLAPEMLVIDPALPPELDRLDVVLCYRDHWDVSVTCRRDRVRVSVAAPGPGPIAAEVCGERVTLHPGESHEVRRSRAREEGGSHAGTRG